LLIDGQNSHPAGSLKIALQPVKSRIFVVLVGGNPGVSNTIMVNEMQIICDVGFTYF